MVETEVLEVHAEDALSFLTTDSKQCPLGRTNWYQYMQMQVEECTMQDSSNEI
jgi:hypothetical protein